MCKNNSFKIWTRTSGEGVVLKIRMYPDRGMENGLKIRDFGGRPLSRRPL